MAGELFDTAGRPVIVLATQDAVLGTTDQYGRPIKSVSAIGLPQVISKTADETVNDSAVLQDDAELKLAVGANEIWAFDMLLWVNSGTAPDIKVGWTVPAGGAGQYSSSAGISALSATQFFPGAAQNDLKIFSGSYIGAAAAGTLQLQWTQNTQTASDTKVLKGSCLIAYRIV